MKLRFSDKIGVTKPPDTFQIKGMNDSLRNTIWNYLYTNFLYNHRYVKLDDVLELLCYGFFKIPVDELPYEDYRKREWLKEKYSELKWFEIYNLLEFICPYSGDLSKSSISLERYTASLNLIFEVEMSGYRFINEIISPITNKLEIESIEKAIADSEIQKLYGTSKHINTAIELLSKRPDPDYRNSIKESISAIESLVKYLVGEKGGGLDRALTKIESKIKFHPQFKTGIINLYNYTSDSSGIRHSIMDEPNSDFDDAKFMLVSCSALVNFLIAKAEKAGLLK